MPNSLSPSPALNAVHTAPEMSPFEVPLYLHHAFHFLVQFMAAIHFGGPK
jgi:hypothetical protein